MTSLRVGVIGTGFGANTLLPLLGDLADDVAVIALCGGKDTHKSASLAARYAIPVCTQDFREVVDIPDLDVLFVASPHGRHYEVVRYASPKPCHIVCEKPLALTTRHVDELISLNDQAKYLRLVSHQLRFHPAFTRAKALLDNGNIGRPLCVTVRYETDRYIKTGRDHQWWFEREQGGGMLLAVGTHLVDLIAYLFDEMPEAIHCWCDTSAETMKSHGYPGEIDAESVFKATLRLHPDILVGLFASGVSYTQAKGLRLRIRGTAGELGLGPTGELKCVGACPEEYDSESRRPDLGEPVFRSAYRYFLAGILDLIKGRRNDLEAFPTFASYGACHSVLEDLRETDGHQG